MHKKIKKLHNMKKLKQLLKRFKTRFNKLLERFKSWFNRLLFVKWVKNLIGFLISQKHFIGKPKQAKVFYGFNHFELAKKYARKRFKWWSPKFNQLGKNQGVFASGDESLIVISPMEIKLLKKKDIINSEIWYSKTFKKENLYKVI